ncbi:hypothetical protein [Paenirhodobacter populi]|uniref:Uncharacterized protein n=1 Tax=Paenirhodobacter populi TaxID=2306993 RepID=A0A443JRF0_9RHOB|nr:hypothetical protein [Sinirhodobacter populi]RWR23093.1 hypothetical protein D2T30_05585 [Sinirhodobacter populi]
MTVAFDITKSTAIPPVRVTAAIAAAPAQPLILTCIGEVEHVEKDPVLGTWWQQQTLAMGRCENPAEAIAMATRAAAQGAFPQDDGAQDFSPILVVILDTEKRLVLAGEVSGRDIQWCEPVATDLDVRKVVTEASRIRADASYEAGLDNFRAAKALRHRASVLEGRLVDPLWREEIRLALREIVQ